MRTLLLDFGTSFIKYSFYNPATMENSEIFYKKFPDALIDDGVHYEVDRRKIEEILFSITDEAEKNMCESVFICTQMHGYIIQSKEGFSNYISWRDRRGDSFLEGFDRKKLLKNGTSLKGNLPLVSLHSYSDLKHCRFFTLGSYIAYILTGNNITHITDACASGFFCADTCKAENVFEGLELPRVTNEVAICGKYKNVNVYAPLGDHQISFLGSGAAGGEAVLNLGTAAQLSALICKSAEMREPYEYRPYFSDKERLITLSGMKSSNISHLIARISESINCFRDIKRVLICGGASKNSSEIGSALNKLGYQTEILERNVGNEGLKRIANSVFSKCGTMLSEVEFVNFPYVMKKSGLDFFIIDNEHGSFENKNISVMATNSKNAGIEAIVRLPNSERALITKLADGGVSSFLLSMTNTKEDIEKVVEHAKYTPVGKRGISTTRAHTGYGVSDLKSYLKLANEKMKIYAQIESRSGVENIDEILNVEGIDGIFIGPNDLSCDYDCMGDKEKIKELITMICKSAVKHGKPCGIITSDKQLIKHAFLCGCHAVSCGSEINMMLNGAKEIKNEKYL